MVVSIAVLMLTLGIPASASAHATTASVGASWSSHTIVVLPNGHDDTWDIQAAFNTCTSHNWVCTIQLGKGTYYTAQIYAFGFSGSFVGAGQGRTIIQALPNLAPPNPADNTPTIPFWAGAPTTATGSNPWPVLFTFVNGTFLISGMSMFEPCATPIASPGWYNNPNVATGVESTSLYAVVLVTGTEAYASIDQVTVIGAAGDLTIPIGVPSTFNLADGIVYEGMLLPSVWTSMWGDQIPLSGAFSVTRSVSDYSISAIWAQNLLDASATVCYNSINSNVATGFWDISNTQFVFCGNRVTNVPYAAGFGALQSVNKFDLLPSTVYVMDNYFAVNWAANGVWFEDLGPYLYGVAATLSAIVSGNTVVSDTSCDCYLNDTPVLGFVGLASFAATGNTLLGGGVGVGVIGGPGSISFNVIRGALEGVGLGCPAGTGCALYPEVAAS
ncbi:MAG TPA: hypothetical protein VEH57_03790, partial [Thermoplasmata archaeon]|nr:hypothetical protein [Thermoplasmata archaeon]